VATDAAATVCAGCLSRHHAPCWREGGACGSCGQARALEAPSAKAGPGGCACCGLQGARARYSCPCCKTDVCEGCYRLRYRRCAGCATELLQGEKKLELSKKRLEQAEAALALTIIGAIIAAAITVVLAAKSMGFLAVASSGLVTAFIVSVCAACGRRHLRTREEIEALEVQLAAFPPLAEEGLTAKGVKWLKGKLGLYS
jgi:hypothetical protein